MSTNNMCLVFAVLLFIGCILSFKVRPQSLWITAESPNLHSFGLFWPFLIECKNKLYRCIGKGILLKYNDSNICCRLQTLTEHLFPVELPFYRYCHVIKAIKSHTVHMSCNMNHMVCTTNLPVWTFSLSMFFTRLSHSQRAAGQGQQETNSCQANSPLMHGWFSRRSYALGLWDEMGHEVAVICTIKSSHFSSKLILEMFSADIQSQSQSFVIGSSHWKIHCWTYRERSYKCHISGRELCCTE